MRRVQNQFIKSRPIFSFWIPQFIKRNLCGFTSAKRLFLAVSSLENAVLWICGILPETCELHRKMRVYFRVHLQTNVFPRQLNLEQEQNSSYHVHFLSETGTVYSVQRMTTSRLIGLTDWPEIRRILRRISAYSKDFYEILESLLSVQNLKKSIISDVFCPQKFYLHSLLLPLLCVELSGRGTVR